MYILSSSQLAPLRTPPPHAPAVTMGFSTSCMSHPRVSAIIQQTDYKMFASHAVRNYGVWLAVIAGDYDSA